VPAFRKPALSFMRGAFRVLGVFHRAAKPISALARNGVRHILRAGPATMLAVIVAGCSGGGASRSSLPGTAQATQLPAAGTVATASSHSGAPTTVTNQCVLNTASSGPNAPVADCYVDYSGTITQDWQLAYTDFDDGDGSCSTITIAPNSAAASMGATITPASGSCTSRFRAALTTNVDPKSGPRVVNIEFDGTAIVTDATDGVSGFPEAFTITMVVHIGTCAPGAVPSSVGRNSASPSRVSRSPSGSVRKPRTGSFADAEITATPIIGGPPACSPPPPPDIAKLLYTASLVSNPSLAFTDSADPGFGALTWHVSGDISTFSNLQFASQKTNALPNANALSFNVTDSVMPGDFSIHVNVTAASGATSSDTVVVLRVLSPVSSQGEVNASDIYEQDAQGNIVVPDGSTVQSDDDGQVPDFPFIATNLDTLNKARRTQAADAGFDPFNPPPNVVKFLNKTPPSSARFGCEGWIAESNAAGDLSLGASKAVGQIRVVSYCLTSSLLPMIVLFQTGVNLNREAESKELIIYAQKCQIIGSYGRFNVCASDVYTVAPALGHAERAQFSFNMAWYRFFNPIPIVNPKVGGFFYINNKGVFYPKVKILDPNWAIAQVYNQDNHYVPFPTHRPFQYCPGPKRQLPCATSNTLQTELLKWLKPPPAGFQAHHILPLSWCGQNNKENGVFLPELYDDPNGEYNDNTHGQFTYWWLLSNFKPDDTVENCH